MNTAIFYENFMEGIQKDGLSERETLAELKAMGLNKVYMSLQTLTERESELLALLGELDLGIEGLFWFFDFGHHPEDMHWKDLIDAVVRIGAKSALIVPGMLPEADLSRWEECLENMAAALARAVAYGKEKHVDVVMEDFDSLDAPYCSVAGLRWFMDQVDGLGCCFDTGNFIMFDEDELEAFDIFKDKIALVHLKDRARQPFSPEDKPKACKDGHNVYASPVGQGYIRMEAVLERLRAMGYAGTVVIENFDYTDMIAGLRQSLEWLKERYI